MIDRAGGNPQRLASLMSSLGAPPLVWRRDGILIPFERANAGFGLRRISEAGELSTVPNPCGQLLPIWSKDQSHVACTSRLRPQTAVVWTVAGRVVRRVALYPLGQSTRAGVAGLGAKGAPLIYTATVEDRDADLWLRLLDGTLRKLTTGPGEDHDPSWSPDRRRVVFVRGEREQRSGRRGRLMVVDVGSGRTRPLRPGLVGREPDWSPDGRRLVYSRGGDLFVVRVGTGRPVQLTRGKADDVDPAWSPDGRRIAFVRNGTRAELSTIPARGGRRRCSSRGSTCWILTWSPDGRTLAFSTDTSIAIVRQSTRRVERVVDDMDNNLRSPTWARDGRSLVYAAGWEADIPYPWQAPNAHPFELWRVGLAGGLGRAVRSQRRLQLRPGRGRLSGSRRGLRSSAWTTPHATTALPSTTTSICGPSRSPGPTSFGDSSDGGLVAASTWAAGRACTSRRSSSSAGRSPGSTCRPISCGWRRRAARTSS